MIMLDEKSKVSYDKVEVSAIVSVVFLTASVIVFWLPIARELLALAGVAIGIISLSKRKIHNDLGLGAVISGGVLLKLYCLQYLILSLLNLSWFRDVIIPLFNPLRFF